MSFPSTYIAGIDIGGTNVRCGLAAADRPQEILIRRTAPTPAGVPPPSFVDFLGTELERCFEEAGLPRSSLAAVGCAAPGITDADAGVVRAAANLRWPQDVPLAALLEHRLEVPSAVENDVRAAALAEYRHGAGTGRSSLVYLTVSTGVSAGIIVGGRLLRGHHLAAGEIAHLLPDPDYIGADWGENGCLELTSAGVGIARAWAAARGGSSSPAAAARVFELARGGDAEAAALVRRAADHLAQAAVALGAIIDPEVLVLGGSIAEKVPAVRERIREVTAAALPFPVEVVQARLGGDAPLVGAHTLAASLNPKSGVQRSKSEET